MVNIINQHELQIYPHFSHEIKSKCLHTNNPINTYYFVLYIDNFRCLIYIVLDFNLVRIRLQLVIKSQCYAC